MVCERDIIVEEGVWCVKGTLVWRRGCVRCVHVWKRGCGVRCECVCVWRREACHTRYNYNQSIKCVCGVCIRYSCVQ